MNKIWVTLFTLCFATSLFANNLHTGITVSGGNLFDSFIKEEPHGVHGGRVAAVIRPQNLQWGNMDLQFDVSIGHWRSQHGQDPRNVDKVPNWINTYTIAPIFRYFFFKSDSVSPYFIGSVGPTLLSSTHFAGRDFSILFCFQDKAGLGVAFGKQQQFFVDLQVLHYSNANLGKSNPGITIPLVLGVGFAFD